MPSICGRRAQAEAEATRQKAELESERNLKQQRTELERELDLVREELRTDQARLKSREDNLDQKMEQLADRDGRLERREADLKVLEDKQAESGRRLDVREQEIMTRLAEVSGLSIEDAKAQLHREVEERSQLEAAAIRRQILEQAEGSARKTAVRSP